MNQLPMTFKPTRATIKQLGGEGVLSHTDMGALNGGVRKVFMLMRDGAWYTREQIELAAGSDGIPAAEGMRRMRELRQWFNIEMERVGESRLFRYRLTQPEPRKSQQWWIEK